jgi:hypothetical protein
MADSNAAPTVPYNEAQRVPTVSVEHEGQTFIINAQDEEKFRADLSKPSRTRKPAGA